MQREDRIREFFKSHMDFYEDYGGTDEMHFEGWLSITELEKLFEELNKNNE